MADLKKIFSKIYDQHIDKIYRFVFLKVNSQEVAEDLTSETFLKGWEAYNREQDAPYIERRTARYKQAQNPESKIQNPQAFLYQIARNLVTDYYREKGKAQVVSAEFNPIIDPRSDLEEKTMLNSDLDTVKAALSNLKEDYQNVIIWHYLDDLPIQEVAKMLDRTEETTRVLLHRALKSLKNEIKLS